MTHVRPPRDSRGAAAVEFALVSMVLLALVVGIIQYAIYFWAYQAGANGAREGARRYAVDPCGSGQPALVIDRIGGAAASTQPVAVTPAFSKDSGNTGSGHEAGDRVTVTVTFAPHEIAGGFIPMPDEITQTATARVEDVEDCS